MLGWVGQGPTLHSESLDREGLCPPISPAEQPRRRVILDSFLATARELRMHDVFRAVTLSFLIATLYLVFSAAVDYIEIFALQSGDLRYTQGDRFRMALATTSLLASLLCVWVLLVTAFAKKYVTRLRPRTTLVAALSVAAPIALLNLLLQLVDARGSWSPAVSLGFSLLWTSVGLHVILWYLTAGADSNAA